MSVNLWKSFMLQKIPSLDGYKMKEKRYKCVVLRRAQRYSSSHSTIICLMRKYAQLGVERKVINVLVMMYV